MKIFSKPFILACLTYLAAYLLFLQPLTAHASTLYLPVAEVNTAPQTNERQLSPDLTIDLRSTKRNVILRAGGATFSWCYDPEVTGCDDEAPDEQTVNDKGETIRYFGNVQAQYCTGQQPGNCRKDAIEEIKIYEDGSAVIIATDSKIGRLRISFCAFIDHGCTNENLLVFNQPNAGLIKEYIGQPTWQVGDVEIIKLP